MSSSLPAVSSLSLQADAAQPSEARDMAQKAPLVAHGPIFGCLADTLPMMSLDVIGVVAQYVLDELIVKVGGDLDKLSQMEKTAMSCAAQDVKHLDLGEMALTIKNALQIEKQFPGLETIVERGKKWSWKEWKNTPHPVANENELAGISPEVAWCLASLYRAMFQSCDNVEGIKKLKKALVQSPFYVLCDNPRQLVDLQTQCSKRGIDPIQHRLAAFFFAKLLPRFKVEGNECVFYGKTMTVRLNQEFSKFFWDQSILPELKNISPALVGEIMLLLRNPLIVSLNHTVNALKEGILKMAFSIPEIHKLLPQEECAAIMKLLSLTETADNE